ncbi:MAG: DUF2334 domain-containing protein [Gudongella sp.]|jgi:peptidoglycan/xylan/chitin deacetylase (PgdA/CDA1 family)|nr:DUF2334 domain-containing protein [Gudongella sp.]
MYLLRLDDASDFMDTIKWDRMEFLLNKYSVKPIVGIIPNNQDLNITIKYKRDKDFWKKARKWQAKGWTIALHGYTHVYITKCGGINPVNLQSEFAGVPLEVQKDKIKNALEVFEKQGLYPKIFSAPSHTFDLNTLEALRQISQIRVISDTVANDIYKNKGFHFIPQQCGRVRKLPIKLITFCYHPNEMEEVDFDRLELFINKERNKFVDYSNVAMKDRQYGLYDHLLRQLYFTGRKLRQKLRGFR